MYEATCTWCVHVHMNGILGGSVLDSVGSSIDNKKLQIMVLAGQFLPELQLQGLPVIKL